MSGSLFRERLRSRLDAAAGDGSQGIVLPGLSDDQFALLEAYFALLRHWNRRINLTSLPLDGLGDPTLDRLFVEPLCAARFLDGLLATGADRVNGKTGVGRTLSGPAENDDRVMGDGGEPVVAGRTLSEAPDGILRWADLGSGGGSPAIPLKIACPSTHLTMVESRGRKAAFLAEVARELKLPNVAVESLRAEALPAAGSFDAITVRAVRLDSNFLKTVYGLLSKRGRLILFLPDPSDLRVEGLRLIDRSAVALTNSQVGVFALKDHIQDS